MKLKPNPVLLAAALGTMICLAVWPIFRNGTPSPEAVGRQPRAPRDKHPGEPKSSFSTSRIGKPVREISKDDLMAICDREGAAAALAAAKSQPWPYRDDKVYFILTHLAAENPEFVAAELISSGLNTFLKAGLVDTILENWKDGRKSLDWAETQLTGELRHKGLAGALGILVKSEPQAAFDYFAKMPPCEARSRAIPELFAAWGSHDPATAMMRAKELTPDEIQSATEHVVRGWTKTEPSAAAAWVLQTAPTNERWIARVYQSWISIAPDQAQLWLDSLPEGNAKTTAATLTLGSSGIVMPIFSSRFLPTDHSWTTKPVSDRNDTDLMHWAIQDTEGARSFVEQNGNDPASKQLSAQVAKAIAGQHGPSAAMEWALRLPEGNGNRERALSSVLYDWSEKDPAAVGAMLSSMPPDQYAKEPILLVNTWVNQDPATAADWVSAWKGEHQATMIERVVENWRNQDPQAAYQWLGHLPEGAGRDAGIRTLIDRERDSAPDTLQPWIDLISDPRLREKTRLELDRRTKMDN